MTHAMPARLQEPRADHERVEAPRARPLVLVVDDLPVMRTLIGRYLAHLGFGMVEAGSAEEGVRALRTHDIAHVILDVHFPGGSETVFEAIRSRDDDLHRRTAFVTGGFVDPVREAFVSATGCVTIYKPFELDDLRRFLGSPDGEAREPARTPRQPPETRAASRPAVSTISTSRG